MIVKLYYKGNEYDLTPYVDLTDNSRNDTIEEQFDSGKIVLSRVPANAFVGLDMTRRLPSLCKLYFNNEKEEEPRYFYTADTQCFEIIKDKRWKHEIGLIELTKELQLTPIRDMTITQPQDGNYYSASSARTLLTINNPKSTIFTNTSTWLTINDATQSPFVNGVLNNGINSALLLNNSMQELNTAILDQTNPSVISGTTFKEAGKYVANIKLNSINPNFTNYYRELRPVGWPFPDDKYEVWANQSIVPKIKLYYSINSGSPILISNTSVNTLPIVGSANVDIPSFGTNSNVRWQIQTQEQQNEFIVPIEVSANDEIKFYVSQEVGTFNARKRIAQVLNIDDYTRDYTQRLYLSDAVINLYKETDAELEDRELPIRLGQTVQKIVRLSGIDLEVSDDTLERLNLHGTPENTFTKFTAWDALKEVGATVGALPEIIINEDGEKELKFYYYSDMETDYVVVEPPNVQSIASARNLDNYVGALQLNADNIVSSNLSETSPYNKDYEANTLNAEIATDWLTLRAGSDGNVKITTDNIGIKLPNRIYQMRQVEIKGLDLNEMTGGVLPYDANYVWKLNDDEDQLRILEEKYWQTLEDNNDYTVLNTRILPKKNNTIYYRQGDYRLYGFSFTAQYKPVWDVDPAETAGYRSIYEIVFVKAIIKAGINQTQLTSILNDLKDPGTIAEDNKLKFRITYIPQDYSRATIYKEDLSGFEMPNVEKYYNETAIVNDPLSLGVNAQDTINRLGNTVISYVGYAKPNEQLPFIGSKTADNKILTNITYNDRPYRTDYVASYVQDFSIISDYVGVKSPHRQYEIPSDGIVLALDKNKTHIFVDTQPIVSTPTVWGNNIKEFFDLKNVTYDLTTDIAIDENKVYFTKSGDNYTAVTSPVIVNIGTYYEAVVKSKAPLFAEVSTYEFDTNYNEDTADGLFIRPLTKTPTGRTINFKYQMDSNFSAGATKKKTEIGGEPVYWQEEVPYTTKFGRLYGARVRLVKDVYKNTITTDPVFPTVEDKFPKLDENVVTAVYTDNKYVVDKDAREIMALSEEVAFHSNKVNDIILYDGITKFNPMTLTDLSRNNIKIAIMNDGYKISKSAKKVDYAGLQSVGGSILNGITYTLYDNRIEFNLPPEAQGKGLVIYNDNVDSGDLVMIYLTKVNGSETKTMYFGTKKLGE